MSQFPVHGVKMHRRHLSLFFLFAAHLGVLLTAGCKRDPPVVPPPPPPPYQQTIHIAVEDVSCTEVWLKVSLTDLVEPRTIAITQDGETKLSSRIAGADSIFLLENLLPNRNYRFAAQRIRDTTITDTSGTVVATTLDTTSHNFTWQIDTLGDGNASTLNDIAIINDTLAYAVGELYLRDSTGQIDPHAWNAAKWDGNSWQQMRIPFIGSCSAVVYPPLKTIWAVSANQILVTNGGAIATYNGSTTTLDCRMNSLLVGAINKLYATSAQDIYAVGNNGTIVAYYSGTSWQRLESGTTLPINDVWGVRNATSGATEIYAVASMIFQNEGRKILKLNSSSVTSLPDSGTSSSLRGMWFAQRGPYYVVGAGVHFKRDISSSTPWIRYVPGEVTNYFSTAIRGTARNDVVVVGDFGEIVHFNGMTWRNYLSQTRINGSYYGVSIKGNLIVAVGQVHNRGVVAVGRR